MFILFCQSKTMKRVLFLKYLFSWENELFVPLFCRFLKAKIYLFTISVEHKGNVDQGYSVYRWLDGKAVMQSFFLLHPFGRPWLTWGEHRAPCVEPDAIVSI